MKSNKLLASALAIIALTFPACGKQKTAIETECVINADQTTTFAGKWATTPIPVGLYTFDFTAPEIASLQAAADTWNSFFGASKGIKLYFAGGSSSLLAEASGTKINPSTICSNPVISTGGYSRKIYIYKVTSSWAYGADAIGVTSTCHTAAGGQFDTMTSGIMVLNFKDFFAPGKPVPNLQTIALHELGHLGGLRHSCGTVNGASIPCSDSYIEAAMYPTTGFHGLVGNTKNELNSNDQGRANCLY